MPIILYNLMKDSQITRLVSALIDLSIAYNPLYHKLSTAKEFLIELLEVLSVSQYNRTKYKLHPVINISSAI